MSWSFKKYEPIPQRWIVASMGFLAFFNAYTLRICLSVTITKMTTQLNNTHESVDETCPEYESYELKNSTSEIKGTFEWNEHIQGIILSSFYWGYVITHIPMGLIVTRYGAKHTVGLGLLFTAVLTVITPEAILWGDATAMIVLRFLMGLCEGVFQPGISCLLAQWIPSQERSVVCTFVYSGIKLGMLVSSILSGIIMGRSSDNWSYVFYIFGGIGILSYIFWTCLVYNNPKDAAAIITVKEKKYLDEHMSGHIHEKIPPFPWREALTSRPFLAVVIMQCGQDWCSYTIMSDLPKYMNNVLKLPVHLNGYASSMHNISSWIFSMTMSWLSDYLIVKNYVTRTNIRKGNTAISSIGPAVLLLLAMYAGCNVVLAISLITIGLTLSGSALIGIKVNPQDLAGNYAGALMGIQNGVGALAGVFAPYTVALVAPNSSLDEWRLIFWIVAIVYFVTTLNFMLSASGEVQPWNDPAFKECKNQEEDINLLHFNRIKYQDKVVTKDVMLDENAIG